MVHYDHKKLKKTIIIASFIGIILCILRGSNLSGLKQSDLRASAYKQPMIDKHQKYYYGGQEERFTFYARENDHSSRMLERRGIIIRYPQAEATV
ncbi:MAG TPA: hypothetical protein VHA52_00245, partial [Candidatus Babeliaceae bacterium]|nr:hypothetical protein [Candidatus Babeliaceae bacterium]